MIKIPLPQIIEKIIEKTGLSNEEIMSKIQKKKEQLSGLISDEGAAHIIANEHGISLFEEHGMIKIKNILPGMKNVEVIGKVTAKFDVREFTSQRGPGKVGSFIIGDENGTIRVVLWGDQTDLMQSFEKDDVLKIGSAYAKDNQGRLEIHINDKASIEVNPEGIKITINTEPTRIKISEIKPDMQNVEVFGTIVQIYDPRFFEVCTTCSKRMVQQSGGWACQQHGIQEPKYSYVLNAFLDDGSGNMRGVFFTEQACELLGKTHEEILAIKDNDGFEAIKNDILGKQVIVLGRIQNNQMFNRIEIIAQKVNTNPDPDAELIRISKEEETAFEDLKSQI